MGAAEDGRDEGFGRRNASSAAEVGGDVAFVGGGGSEGASAVGPRGGFAPLVTGLRPRVGAGGAGDCERSREIAMEAPADPAGATDMHSLAALL